MSSFGELRQHTQQLVGFSEQFSEGLFARLEKRSHFALGLDVG